MIKFSLSSIRGLIVLITVLGSAATLSAAEPAANLYSQTIVLPVRPPEQVRPEDALNAAVNDAKGVLLKMTGEAFDVTTEDKLGEGIGGIVLVRADSKLAPADAVEQLKPLGREPFVIRSVNEPAPRLLIIANRDDGLVHGLYFYLEQLGARFFFPNENWTVIPKRDDVRLDIDRLVAPAFRARGFSGTGGFGPFSPVDPDGRLQKQWQLWRNRNRFGGEYHLSGHYGETFNLAHKETLLKHPEYMAEVNGKREYSLTAKHCASNKELVALYVKDRVEDLRRLRQQAPDTMHSVTVSVDPADGGGHCECAACKKIGNGSVSDRVFYLANEAARAIRKEFPDGYVNLYAYHEHAAVPSIELEPNILVTIIPYAFQNTGLTPEQFIAAWGEKKSSGISLYDYWSITDWTHDRPEFDFTSVPREKIRFWNRAKIEGLSCETTHSAGAMGIGWYLASRLLWDPQADDRALLAEFYELAFGPAEAPMKRMLERWAGGYMQTSHELGLSYRDLREAMGLAKDDPAVMARLDDYGRYLHYLRLHNELYGPAPAATAGATPEEVAAATQAADAARLETNKQMTEHLFDIYDSAMVASFRLYQFTTDYGRNKPVYDLFPIENKPTDKDAAGWKAAAPLTHDEIVKLLDDGAAKYKPLDFEPRRFTGKLVPVDAPPAPPAESPPTDGNTGTAIEPGYSPALILVGSNNFMLHAPPDLKRFTLKVTASAGSIRVKLLNSDGREVFRSPTDVAGVGDAWKEKWTDVPVDVPGPGQYTLALENRGQGVMLKAPAGVRLVLHHVQTYAGGPSPKLYFYVPKGTPKVAIYQPYEQYPFTVFDAEGKPTPPELHDGGRMILATVPKGHDGRVWALDYVRAPDRPIRMLTVPNVFSLFPDTLLVPEDALGK